jgi:hypothetical protein
MARTDVARLVPAVTALVGTAVIGLLAAIWYDAAERPLRNDLGIPRCPPNARQDLLSPDALQCWFEAPHGRWRALSRVSAHGALVVEVEADDLLDAEGIARQFVSDLDDRFSEILVYVRGDSGSAAPVIRRVRWTRQAGFETLQFTDAPAR